MQRYFINEPYAPQASFEVTGENYHHMVRVMRMVPKDQVYLVFTDQVSILAEITAVTEETVSLIERSKETLTKELPSLITIACGYPKGDKLELIVQKGTELGAFAFIGFPAKNSVVKWDEKKLKNRSQRLRKIAQEAAEQSHRQVRPQVTLLKSEPITSLFDQYDAVLIAYEEAAKTGETGVLVQTLQELTPGSRLLVLFGPEGGFAPAEIEQYVSLGARTCGLGPRILRAETAPLYLLSAASYQWELKGGAYEKEDSTD